MTQTEINSERNWTVQGRDHGLATFCGSSLAVVQREAQIVGINTAGGAFSERCQSGRGHATHLRCSTNILPSRCFNDWRFANRAKPSDGNCASRGQTREASALAGGWLCVEGARWLPGIYRPLAGRGPARGSASRSHRGRDQRLARIRPPFPSLSYFLTGSLPSSPHHRQPASGANALDPRLTITKPLRTRPEPRLKPKLIAA